MNTSNCDTLASVVLGNGVLDNLSARHMVLPFREITLNFLNLKNKADLFEDSYDGLKGHGDHIIVKPAAKPVFQLVEAESFMKMG